jgi:hypothetical protein
MDILLEHILFLEFLIAESARVDWLSTWRAALGPEIWRAVELKLRSCDLRLISSGGGPCREAGDWNVT